MDGPLGAKANDRAVITLHCAMHKTCDIYATVAIMQHVANLPHLGGVAKVQHCPTKDRRGPRVVLNLYFFSF